MLFLRQSTASQTVLIGPFLDDTDFVTEETGLTIANTDIRISKNGANTVSKNSGGGTHDELGWYAITLDATDTNTVGRLQLYVSVAGALPVWHEYQVLEEATYDDLFASGAAALAKAAALATVDSEIGVIDGIVDAILVDTAVIGAAGAGLTEAGGTGDHLTAVPWNAAWDAEVQSEAADALTAYDPPTRAELTSDIGGLDTKINTIDSNVDAILVDTGTTIPATIDALPTAAENATAVLTTAMTEAYSTDGGTRTVAQALYEIAQLLQESSVSGTTVTIKKVDGTTTAYTLTTDDATTPTSVTRAT